MTFARDAEISQAMLMNFLQKIPNKTTRAMFEARSRIARYFTGSPICGLDIAERINEEVTEVMNFTREKK